MTATRRCTIVVLLLAAACNPTTTRPAFAPFLDAHVDTLLVEPETAIGAVANRLRTDGYDLRSFSTVDRFLETRPHRVDGVDGRPGTVVIRVWADPAAGRRTRITAETVFERVADPSRTQRDREALAPYDHPTRVYLRALLADLRQRLTP